MPMPDAFVNAIQNSKVPQFKYYTSVGSTNLLALDWLQEDAPDGAIIFADHQSSGRGRFERKWLTEPGSALAVSIIVRPTIKEAETLALFSPLAAVALLDVLSQNLGIDAQIKWPNDVLIQRMKTAGILTETVWDGAKLLGLVVGIGINILPQSVPPPEYLEYPATCLQNHCSVPVERFEILSGLLNAFSEWRSKIQLPVFMNQWQNSLAFRGERVYIKQKDGNVQTSGVLLGLTSDGNLEILTDDNQKQTVMVGDVHLRPAEPEK